MRLCRSAVVTRLSPATSLNKRPRDHLPSTVTDSSVVPEAEVVRSIFGVPLITSIPYANVAISLFNENGESYIYGYVPIVVAKCGVFLKEKGQLY
jgi:hypothetical protein